VSPALLDRLEFLSSQCVPQLIAGLMVCEAVLLIVSSHHMAILVFLVQRSILTILLWPTIGPLLARMNAVALGAVALIYCVTLWRLRHATKEGAKSAGPLGSVPFRLVAACLGMLLLHGLVWTYSSDALPFSITLAAVSLILNGLLIILVGGSGQRAGLGVLVLADVGRLLYAFSRPDALVWGLWNACDVVVGLAASYLHSVRVATREGPPVEASE